MKRSAVLVLLFSFSVGHVLAQDPAPPPGQTAGQGTVQKCDVDKKISTAWQVLRLLEQGKPADIGTLLDPAMTDERREAILQKLQEASLEIKPMMTRYESSAIMVYPKAEVSVVHLRYTEPLPDPNDGFLEHYFIGVAFRTDRCEPLITDVEVIGEEEMMRRSRARMDDRSIPPPPPFSPGRKP